MDRRTAAIKLIFWHSRALGARTEIGSGPLAGTSGGRSGGSEPVAPFALALEVRPVNGRSGFEPADFGFQRLDAGLARWRPPGDRPVAFRGWLISGGNGHKLLAIVCALPGQSQPLYKRPDGGIGPPMDRMVTGQCCAKLSGTSRYCVDMVPRRIVPKALSSLA